MSIKAYQENGETFYRVYVQARGKTDPSLRVQKLITKIRTFNEAKKLERRYYKEVVEGVSKQEGRGLTWGEIVERWEIKASIGHLGDKYLDRQLRNAHVNRLTQYTRVWWNTLASDLTKGDGRRVINMLLAEGKGVGLIKNLKSSVNVVFNWGIEEKYIVGVHTSPVQGLIFSKKEERVPQILTLEEIKTLLREAKKRKNPWFPIWSFALLTGMRSGELLALQWKDIDMEKKVITVSKSYNNSTRKTKCTKAGYWRIVPISDDLMEVILDLKNEDLLSPEDQVLKRNYAWMSGQAGKVLRQFLKDIGIKSNVVFHSLRACFATHMLASGVDQATVMKIGGWKDIKTFQVYVRLAGIEVRGATDALKVMPSEQVPTDSNVVNMNEFMRGV